MNNYEEKKDDIEDTGDKIKSGFKAVGEKIKDPDKDLETEYNKERVKEEVKDQT